VEANAKNGAHNGNSGTKSMRAGHEEMRGRERLQGDTWKKEISGGGRRGDMMGTF
jgi:hypothetical protein